MPFALPLLFLLDLFAAALTFSIVASVPVWRRSAITAPVFVFIAAPMPSLTLAAVLLQLQAKTLFKSDFKIASTFLFLTAASVIAAYAAALTCRFIFRTVAPRLEAWLGLRPFLLLQAAILCGGTLSLLVLLLLGANLAHQIWLWGPHRGAVAGGLVCALGVMACFLALLRLRKPEQYLPKPLPKFVGQRIYGSGNL
jgi:hypothetical protein